MTEQTTVATANVLCTLGRQDADAALRGVLDLGPDLVGLQEWSFPRRRLLTRAGGYVWGSPLLGECPVAARADRFEPLGVRSSLLAGVSLADPGVRPLRLVPPRAATVAVYRDRAADRTVSLVNFHLTPGVQARGRYRSDRPRLVARHRAEVAALTRLVEEQLERGYTVYAVGDSNFDGLRLPGLTSAWEGREDGPGTLGSRRKIDDVFGPGPADEVTLLSSPSDHKAVVVRRADVS
jgi:hypothetical protein